MSGADQQFLYRAFISYSHRDKAWGDWLHKAIETYRVPKPPAGTQGRDGIVPARLMPVFRDREELPSSADLGQQISQGLEKSAYLIVICSPHAAKSRWVNEEILSFKRMGRENRILAVIVAGEPNASDSGHPELECFPHALRFALGANGEVGTTPLEPIAADVRKDGDGRKNAALKIIAGLIGVGFDSLAQREKRRQRQRRMLLASGVALLGSGMAAAGYAWWDYTRVRTDYFVNFGTHEGMPFGIGKVSADQARHRHYNFAVDSQRGQVLEMRLENGSHTLQPISAFDSFRGDDYSEVAVVTVQRQGSDVTLHMKDRYGAETGTVSYHFSDPGHATVHSVAKNDAPYLKANALADLGNFYDKYVLDKTDGASTMEYVSSEAQQSRVEDGDAVFDARGNLAHRTFHTAAYVIDSQFDSRGLAVLVNQIDPSGLAVAFDGSYSIRRMRYDAAGDLVEESRFDHDGQPTMVNGWHTRALSYDANYNPVQETFAGTTRQPIDCAGGFHVVNWTYDDRGNPTKGHYAHLAPDEAVTDFNPDIAKSYDSQGRLIEVRASDYRMRLSYDDKGYPARLTWPDNTGNPGHYITWHFNSFGHSTQEDNFGAGGRLEAGVNGFAQVKRIYSEAGDMVEEDYFGTDGRPIANQDGVATVLLSFDDRHDIISDTNYGISGLPVLNSYGYFRAYRGYDRAQRRIRESYFGTDGMPVANRAGYAYALYRFLPGGQELERAWFGPDGKPANNKYLGYARKIIVYDSAGNWVNYAMFDAQGQLVTEDYLGNHKRELQ